MANYELEYCERCGIKAAADFGTYAPGVRGSMAWRCAACRPMETADAEDRRQAIIGLRREASHGRAS